LDENDMQGSNPKEEGYGIEEEGRRGRSNKPSVWF